MACIEKDKNIGIVVGPPWPCSTSLDEARSILRDFSDGRYTPQFSDPSRLEPILHHYNSIIAGYEAGLFFYDPPPLPQSDPNFVWPILPEQERLANEAPLLPEEAAKELEYPEEDVTLKFPINVTEVELIPISPSSSINVLQQEVPVGTINPPLPGTCFSFAPLRLPVPGGMKEDHSMSTVVTPSELGTGLVALPQTSEHEIVVNIVLPEDLNNSGVIPVPIGSRVVNLEADPTLDLLNPERRTVPITWELAAPYDSISYSLTRWENLRVKEEDRLISAPSPDEQSYWRGKLPLPSFYIEAVGDAISRSQLVEAVEYLAGWISSKDPVTGLSNFRYIANPYFGEFLRENAMDLPLILSELRVGHCDPLAWYTAALCRSFGIAAWATSEGVTTEDGTAFNGAYAHARVLFLDESGKIRVFDPSTSVNFDAGYHTSVLTRQDVSVLSEAYKKATTQAEKIVVLRTFNKDVIPENRELARKDEKTVKEIEAIFGTPIGNLRDDTNDLTGDVELRTFRTALLPLSEITDLESLVQMIYQCRFDIAGSHRLSKDPKNYGLWNSVKKIAASNPATAGKVPDLDRDCSMDSITQCLSVMTPNDLELIRTILKGAKKIRLRHFGGEPIEQIANPPQSQQELIKNIYSPLNWGDVNFRAFLSSTPRLLVPAQSVTDPLTVAELKQSLVSLHANILDSESLDMLELLRVANLADLFVSKDRRFTPFVEKYLRIGKIFRTISQDRNADIVSMINGTETHYIAGIDPQHFKKLFRDLMIFAGFFQQACLDPTVRKEFYKRCNFGPKDFRKLCEFVLSEPHEWKAIGFTAPKIREAFYLENDCKERLHTAFKQRLAALDRRADRAATPDLYESRPYQFGDDARRIDWKHFAKSDRLIVRAYSEPSRDVASPLYVYADLHGDWSETLQVYELIVRLMQEKNRVVYFGLGHLQDGKGENKALGYHNLSALAKRMSPSEFFTLLTTNEGALPAAQVRKPGTPEIADGQVPRNLLIVSSLVGQLCAYRYLYPQSEALWLMDRRYDVYPQLRKSYIEEQDSSSADPS